MTQLAAFGVLVVLCAIGMLASLAYVAVSSLGQYLLRRKAVRLSILIDVILFALMVSFLIYGGVVAKYSDGGSDDDRGASLRSRTNFAPNLAHSVRWTRQSCACGTAEVPYIR